MGPRRMGEYFSDGSLKTGLQTRDVDPLPQGKGLGVLGHREPKPSRSEAKG